MKAAIIVNKISGTENSDKKEELKKLFNESTVQADIVDIGELSEEKKNHLLNNGYDVIAAAGGDGTINAAAGMLAGSDIPLGVIPMGTHNHFALDMKIPVDMNDAAAVLQSGKTVRIDLCEVNGHYFVNNSALGLYPHIVGKRKHAPEWIGNKKWLSMFIAFISVFKLFPIYTIEIYENGTKRVVQSPLVFIGNNEYNVDLFKLGDRERLDEGLITLYYAKCRSRLCLLKLVIQSLFGKLRQAESFEMVFGKAFTIMSRKRSMSVALDGELLRLVPPLKYKIHPKMLNVIVPN